MRQSRGHVCQRPNIGSRVNREVHARFWERAEVRFLRATRHSRRFWPIRATSCFPLIADIGADIVFVRSVPILLQKSVAGFCEQ
jgi:hypothetical protein